MQWHNRALQHKKLLLKKLLTEPTASRRLLMTCLTHVRCWARGTSVRIAAGEPLWPSEKKVVAGLSRNAAISGFFFAWLSKNR